jgi:hypothetical protein
MSFLNPLFLIALVAAAIPLLIYLLNVRKPKKVRFSTLAFFESLKQTAIKRLKLKRLLLLAVRMLAILMLVLAAARPLLPGNFGGWINNAEPKAIVVLIDNSPSMQQVDQNGPYFDQALEIAEELIEMADSDDRILLNVTNGETLPFPFVSKAGALARLSDFSIVNKGNYLAGRIENAFRRLENAPEPNKQIYIISDGQETQLSELTESSFSSQQESVHFISVGNAEPVNTGVSSVGLESSVSEGQEELSLRVSIRNYGVREARNQFLNLAIDGELISQQAIQLEAGQTEEYIFPITYSDEKSIAAEVFIEGDELTFDDRQYVNIQLPDTRSVAVISEQTGNQGFQSYLLPLLEVMGEEEGRFDISFYTLQNLDVDNLYEYDAVILDGLQTIPDYLSQTVLDVVQNGGGALLLPAADGDINSYNRMLGFGNAGRYVDVVGSYGSFDVIDRMAEPEGLHPIIDTIFELGEDESVRLNVPELFYLYRIEEGSQSGSFPLLSTRSGQVLLQEQNIGNGRMIFSAIGSDPGWSNFPIKPFYAPFFFRTIEYLARGEGAKISDHKLGERFETVIGQTFDYAEIDKDGETFVPEVAQRFEGTVISYDGKEWEPGFGKIVLDNWEQDFSVNQDAMESRLNSLNRTEIENILELVFENLSVIRAGDNRESFYSNLESASFGKEIWFWFIISAIILLLVESVITRLYKVEII